MRPTLEYIIEKFDYYNQLCFDGKLTRPPILLNTRYHSVGLTIGRLVADEQGKRQWTDLRIEISIRRDLPEYEYIDTIVHEMIHYYIRSNGLQDDSDHGSLFRSIVNRITDKYGVRITMTYSPSEDEKIATRTNRNRFVCVAEAADGHTFMAVVAKNKLFQFWDIIPKMEGIADVKWYVSDRQIFEQFQLVVSPCLRPIEASKIAHYLTGARELENTGEVIKEKSDIELCQKNSRN